MSTIDSNTLKWVKSEIDETLKHAQTSLEAYVEDTDDESQIRFCINYLHQVHGTLQMVELHGAALAIEEMETLAKAIHEDNVGNKEDAYETLMGGILQVPDYLEHLLAGNPDMPVVLLPLLNNLRAARNAALLSEGALFTPDLSVSAPVAEFSVDSGGEGISSLARKIRHNFHLGLLSWFKNTDPKAGLQKISDVISELANAADSDEARRVFWIASALAESLIDDGVETSVAVKMLMGHVDRQIKKIIDDGELALDEEPPEELEKNLLYYVATSSTAGEKTKEIKEAFRLKDIMPDNQALEQARADLTAPNAALMETVSAVIIEDINKVKDNLDIYVRADDKDSSVLNSVYDSLKQMADTLAMLNLGVQREAVLKQAGLINDIVKGDMAADDAELMNIAAAMIAVENSLSEISTAKAASAIEVEEGADAGDTALAQMQGAEQQKLMQTVLDEAKVNLAKVKDGLTVFSQNNDERDELKPIPALLEQVQGSLMILSLEEASNLLALTNNYIRQKLIKETIPPSLDDMNNLADAISSLEYYMESLMGNWGQPEAILDVAIQSIQALGIDTTETAEILELDETETEEIVEDIQLEAPVDNVIELESAKESEVVETADDSGLELSFETDNAEDESLESMLLDSNDELSLNDLSLELSGSDTEAADVNEISLDGMSLDEVSLDEGLSFDLDTDSSSEAEITALDEIKAEEITAPPAPDIDTIQSDAAKPEAIKEPSLLDDTIDDEIIEIFMEEAEEAYQTITDNLPLWVANTTNDEPLKEIRRAYHTLKGSGRLVGAADLGEFAWAYENMLNRVIDNTITASPELLELMELGNNALLELFELFKVNGKPGNNILTLMEHADALSQGKSIDLHAPASIEAEPVEDDINLELDAETAIEFPEAEEQIVLDDSPGLETALELDESIELTEPVAAEESIELEVPIELVDSIEIEEAATETVAEEPLPIEIDPTLLEIYRKEVAVHVDTVKQYIKSWHDDGIITPELSLVRALHTLTGSSRTTGVESLAKVCSSFEHYINHLKDNEHNVPQVALPLLEQTISLVEQTVDCLDKPGATLPAHETLLSLIEALPKEFATTSEVASAPAPVEAEVAMPDYDEELLEIFLEEGTEILDDSDQVIVDWIENPGENQYVEELQRHLHTLKGGARMAGVTELGDLGHSIESLLTAVVDGHMKPSKPMFELVQKAQDRLVKMLELVQDHKGLAPATDLINMVDLMLENRGEIDDLDIFNDSSVAEAPVELTIPDQPEVEESPKAEDIPEIIDIPETIEIEEAPEVIEVSEVPEARENVQEGISIEIPELEKLEEELRMEVEGSTPVPGIEVPGIDELSLEPEALTENIIPPEIQSEEQLPEVSEKQQPAAAPEVDHDRRKSNRVQAEQVRVRADLLDNLVNFAGEVSIYRSRLEQQTNNFRYNITEFDETVNRLREQLRQFEIETETQIEYKSEELSQAQESFDPLEMDRFTTMQHLSRAMMESLGDLDSLRGILNNLTRESETLLLQQSRVNTDLQEGLMRTRMVPFSGQAARLRRIVRQTCSELGKHADLHLNGVDTELDRSVLERIISPVEHMLRNAVAHGIESPEERKKSGKDGTGNIDFSISNEGSEIVIKIQDDGSGINLDAIRNKAISKGLITADAPVTKEMLLDMIMQSGFSTAESVNQIAGRGVGMDVVNTEIKQLGGVFNIDTVEGKGTTFSVSLPLTLAISRALMVMVGDDYYAVPLLSVEGVERITSSKVREIMDSDEQVYNWVGEDYKFMHLGSIMGINEMTLSDDAEQLPMLMVRSGDHHAAILVDDLLGSREIVVKSVGPQLSTLRGISGATIMGDGSVVLIIDLGMLIRLSATSDGTEYIAPMPVTAEVSEERTTPLVMVVDDSITVRKVTTRLLERHEMEVVAAKDGVDALSQLQETIPDIMLLDVEMPRMDGFELATNMRNDERLKNIPIIMITSRTGQKHRDRAASIGVNIYMGKPYTEADLLDNINVLTGKDL